MHVAVRLNTSSPPFLPPTVAVLPLNSLELKFLVMLLIHPDYRADLVNIQPNPKTKPAERQQLCLALAAQGWVNYSERIVQFGITQSGRVLLSLDRSILPVTPDERLVLKSCAQGRIAPAKIHARIPADQREKLIRRLADQGLVQVYQTQIQAVWLTPAGKQVLLKLADHPDQQRRLTWAQQQAYHAFLHQEQP